MIPLEEFSDVKIPKRDVIWSWEYGKKMDLLRCLGVTYCLYHDGEVLDENSCPFDKTHSTGVICKNLEAELFGGNSAKHHKYSEPFIPMKNHGFDLISEKTIESYLRNRLTGLSFDPNINAFSYIGTDEKKWNYSTFKIIGSAGIRKRTVKNGTELKCLKCKITPVMCPGCGILNEICGNCKAVMVAKEPTIDDVYYLKGCPKTIIVDAKDWDGSDFFRIRGTCARAMVSNKAKEWLEAIAPNYYEFGQAILEMADT